MYCIVKHGFLQTVGLGFVISFCLHWESNCYNLCHSTAVKHLAPLYLSMKIAFKGMGTMKEDTWRLTGSFRNCKVPFEICPVACLMSSSPLKALNAGRLCLNFTLSVPIRVSHSKCGKARQLLLNYSGLCIRMEKI